MEIVRNDGNNVDSGSQIAILNADIRRLERALGDRDRALDHRVAALAERISRSEAGIDDLRAEIQKTRERDSAERAMFRERAGFLIAVGLILAWMWAKTFGWL